MDAVQRLEELYSVFVSPAGQEQSLVDEAASELVQMYSDPATLSHLIALFRGSASPSIRVASSVGLHTMLRNKALWDAFRAAPDLDEFKTAMLDLLHGEADAHVLRNLAHAIASVLETEAASWQGYVDLLSSTDRPALALHMAIIFLSKAELDAVAPLWETFVALAGRSLESDDPLIVELAGRVVAELFDHGDELQEGLEALFMQMFQSLSGLLSAESSSARAVIDAFEQISKSEFPFDDTAQIVHAFAGLVTNSEFSIDHRAQLFEPLVGFLGNESFEAVDLVFEVAEESFDPALGFPDQTNAFLVLATLDHLVKVCDNKELFARIQPRAEDTTPSGTFAFLCALATIYTTSTDLLVPMVADHISYALRCLETDERAIQGAAFELVSRVCDRSYNCLHDFCDEVIGAVSSALQSDNESIIHAALDALRQFLSAVRVDGQHVPAVFDVVTAAFSLLPCEAADCCTALLLSAREDSAAIANQTVELMVPAIDANESVLRGCAVECVGALLRHFGDEDLISHFITQVVQCLESGDRGLTKSGVVAVTNLIAAGRPQISPLLSPVVTVIHGVLESVPAFADDEEQEDENIALAQLLDATLSCVAALAKHAPDALREATGTLLDDCYRFVDHCCVHAVALRALCGLVRVDHDDMTHFVELLVEEFTDFEADGVAAAFHNCAKLLDVLGDAEIAVVSGFAVQGAAGQLACQTDKDEYDVDLGGELYLFLKMLANSRPDLFPIDEFWEAVKNVKANGAPLEVAEVVAVLTHYFGACHETMPSLLRKFVVKLFLDALDICDCFTPPDPIAAVRAVIEMEPELIVGQLPAIFAFIDSILEIEYDGQEHHRMTVEYVVSLLFSIFRVVQREEMSTAYLPAMLASLPASSPQEAANIYLSLASLCGEYPRVMAQFDVEVVRVLAQTLGMKAKEWGELDLPVGIAKACAVLLSNLLAAMQQGHDIVASSLQDDLAAERLTQRMQVLLSEESE